MQLISYILIISLFTFYFFVAQSFKGVFLMRSSNFLTSFFLKQVAGNKGKLKSGRGGWGSSTYTFKGKKEIEAFIKMINLFLGLISLGRWKYSLP